MIFDRLVWSMEETSKEPKTTEEEALFFLKERNDSLNRIKEATTLPAIQDVWDDQTEGSELEKIAEIKWDKLGLAAVEKISTLLEAREVWEHTREGSKARELALLKTRQLLDEET